MVIGWNIMVENILEKITKGAGQKIFINHRKDIFWNFFICTFS